ncbi:hypothetical protein [Chthoniobacter flavus]|nr:hypothetical protein [Chthoniobacter flavus]
MRKLSIIAGSLLVLAVLVGIVAFVRAAFTATDPYLVKPLTHSPAPTGARVGHSSEAWRRYRQSAFATTVIWT